METLQVDFENLSLFVRFPQVFLAENSRSGGWACRCSWNTAAREATFHGWGFVARAELATFSFVKKACLQGVKLRGKTMESWFYDFDLVRSFVVFFWKDWYSMKTVSSQLFGFGTKLRGATIPALAKHRVTVVAPLTQIKSKNRWIFRIRVTVWKLVSVLFNKIRLFMEKAECCFCGKSEKLQNMISIILVLNKNNEQQGFMCHKTCIAERLHKDMMLHPDLTDSLDESESVW